MTLIWFVHPQWFQDLGAFSKEENIPVFVDWCETAFKLFGKDPPPSDVLSTFRNACHHTSFVSYGFA